MAEIFVRDLQMHYGPTKVLHDLSLDIAAGDQCVILGASGSGKSTLLYILGGLEVPDAGEVQVGSFDLMKMSDSQKAAYRNLHVGFVFQFHFLLPSMSALDNILLPARVAGKSTAAVEKEILGLAQRLGVGHCMKKYPFELSGGEQQRVNILRAISLRPKILLCDEPTGNLDSKNSETVTNLLKELAKDFDATLVIVTHSEKVANAFTHKIIIEDGRIIR